MKKTTKTNFSLNDYAIVATGGKQYFFVPGKTVQIEKIEGEPGQEVTFNNVLLLKKSSETECHIGNPYLSSAVKATIVKHTKGEKLIVFKFKRRKKYRRKKGHRQNHTVVRCTSL